MIYDSMAITEEQFRWLLIRWRLLFDEGWEVIKHEAGVVYLRRPWPPTEGSPREPERSGS